MPTLKVDGQTLFYQTHGSGPNVIVFLHGGTGDATSYWENQVPYFARDFTVVTLDHRGFGRSSIGETPDYVDACADDIRSVLEHLHVPRAHVVGLSMGGMVAQTFALKYPAMVRRLILADTLSGVRTEKLRRFRDDVLIKTAETVGMEHVFDLNLLWAFSEAYLKQNKEKLEVQRRQWAKESPQNFARALRSLRNVDMTERLCNIIAPTLVIWGSEDIEVPRCYSETLVSNIPHSMLVVIEGAGHKSCVDKPIEFNKVVATFLDEA